MKLKKCPRPGCSIHISQRQKLCARHVFEYRERLRSQGIPLKHKQSVTPHDEKVK
jgi:hypothetical protein